MKRKEKGKGIAVGRTTENGPMQTITTQLQLRLQISRLALCLNHIKETQINWLGLFQWCTVQFNGSSVLSCPFS